MLIEVQPDGSRKILKGDDMMYQQVIKQLEACEAEEIITEDQRVIYEGTEEGTGNVILYMEDGSYKTICLMKKSTPI